MMNRIFVCAIVQFCIIGYAFGQVAQITRLNVQCDRSGMKVNVEFDNPFNGIVFSKGHYSDPNCRYVAANASSNSVEFNIPVESCGTNSLDVDSEDGELTKKGFENIVVFQHDPVYQEIWDHARMIVCRYSVDDDFDMKDKRVIFKPIVIDMLDVVSIPIQDERGEQSRVDCWMEISRGRFPHTTDIDSAVKVGSPLTLAIFVRDPRKRTDIRIKDCYAYDDPKVAESNGPALLQLTDFEGCPTKPKLIEVWKRTNDTGSTGATMIAFTTVTAFKFPDRPDLQLTCNIELCRNTCASRCASEMPEPVSVGAWSKTTVEDGASTTQTTNEDDEEAEAKPSESKDESKSKDSAEDDEDEEEGTQGRSAGSDGEVKDTTEDGEKKEDADEEDSSAEKTDDDKTEEKSGSSEEEKPEAKEDEEETSEAKSDEDTSEEPEAKSAADDEEEDEDEEGAEKREVNNKTDDTDNSVESKAKAEDDDDEDDDEEEENKSIEEQITTTTEEPTTTTMATTTIRAKSLKKKKANVKLTKTKATAQSAAQVLSADASELDNSISAIAKSKKRLSSSSANNNLLQMTASNHLSTTTLRPLKELMDFSQKVKSKTAKTIKTLVTPKKVKKIKSMTTTTTTTTAAPTTTELPTTTNAPRKLRKVVKKVSKLLATTTAKPRPNLFPSLKSNSRQPRHSTNTHPNEFPYLHTESGLSRAAVMANSTPVRSMPRSHSVSELLPNFRRFREHDDNTGHHQSDNFRSFYGYSHFQPQRIHRTRSIRSVDAVQFDTRGTIILGARVITGLEVV